ncbi:MAG TPA: hypothetical protein VF153_04240 [Candidatus Limnocylindria bacterium]
MTEPPIPAEEPIAEITDEEVPTEPDASAGQPRRFLDNGALAWLALLALIGAGVLIGRSVEGNSSLLANPNRAAADAVHATFAKLPPRPLVLVVMDADLGTYPEIRATTGRIINDLSLQDALIAFVSTSVEGRAIAAGTLGSRNPDSGGEPPLDLGFISGSEAGMVRLVDGALRPGMSGPVASLIAQGGGGLGAFDLILVVGGTDIGPRSWVEQVGTRLPSLPMVAIAPTFAYPELAPYVRTGQLDGLLATIRDDAGYAAGGRLPLDSDPLPSSFALRVGMIVALAVLLRQLARVLPRLGSGGSAGAGLDD